MVKEEYMKTFLCYEDVKRYEILIKVIENVINNSLFSQRNDTQKVEEIFKILHSFAAAKEIKPIYIVKPRSNKHSKMVYS